MSDRLDLIEERLAEAVADYRRVFPEPHPLPFNLAIAAEELPALIAFARSVRYAENQGDLADAFVGYLGFNPYEE